MVCAQVDDMDATDAGYADKIATGIDKIKGGFEDLSPKLQRVRHIPNRPSREQGALCSKVLCVDAYIWGQCVDSGGRGRVWAPSHLVCIDHACDRPTLYGLVVLQVLRELRDMAKIEGINMEMVMQEAGGTRFGTLGKRQFKSALGIAFPRYTFTADVYDDLADFYGVGDVDRNDGWDVPEHDLSLREMRKNGGMTQVAWRDFCVRNRASIPWP